jgi:hypothetical protein
VIRLLRGSPHLPTPISGIGDELIFVGAKSGGSVKGKGQALFPRARQSLQLACQDQRSGARRVAGKDASSQNVHAGCRLQLQVARLGGSAGVFESLEVWSL